MHEFRLRFHWSLFLRFELTIFQHWFRWWLDAGQATSHYLSQWWLVYWRIYASHGLNELNTTHYHESLSAKENNSIVLIRGLHLIYTYPSILHFQNPQYLASPPPYMYVPWPIPSLCHGHPRPTRTSWCEAMCWDMASGSRTLTNRTSPVNSDIIPSKVWVSLLVCSGNS